LTEAASQVTTLPPGETRRRPGSAGTPLLATDVDVSEGAILVRGPTVAPAAADAAGWLRTGDLGRLEDGHLYVLGRADDVIVSGGENVSPEEVEHALLRHPDVRDAGVAARPDAEWQQAVTAVVVLREGAAVGEAELREFARERLAPHQVPKRIAFADSLPRDPQGKLRRRELVGD
jgi:acyl-CoA synthetase (AMP-forming)/AMP-acid ligase II